MSARVESGGRACSPSVASKSFLYVCFLRPPLCLCVSVVNTNERQAPSAPLARADAFWCQGRWYSPQRHRGTEGDGGSLITHRSDREATLGGSTQAVPTPRPP